MTLTQTLAVAAGLLFVLGALATFVIAFQRSPKSWEDQLDTDARKADKSRMPAIFGRDSAPTVETEAASEAAAPAATSSTAVAVIEAPVEDVKQVEEISEMEQGVNRRQFFNRALVATFFTALATGGLGSLAFLWPKVSGGFGSDVNAGPVQDIKDAIAQPDGTITPFFMPAAKAWIVPMPDETLADGQFADNFTVVEGLAAVWQKCVHLGCAVPWCQSSQGFECPCHGSKYNFTGEYEAGPAPRNLDRFVVEVVSGELIIKTGDVIPTERAQVKSVKYPQGVFCTSAAAEDEEEEG